MINIDVVLDHYLWKKKISSPNRYIKKKINKLQIKDLSNKNLLSDEIGSEASLISKKKDYKKNSSLFSDKVCIQSTKKI